MPTLPPEQKTKILLSIDRALNAGNCRYADEEKPLCVIGQLAALEGVPLKVLHSWGGTSVKSLTDYTNKRNYSADSGPLQQYPLALLNDLQSIWDTCKEGGQELAVKLMRDQVTAWESQA